MPASRPRSSSRSATWSTTATRTSPAAISRSGPRPGSTPTCIASAAARPSHERAGARSVRGCQPDALVEDLIARGASHHDGAILGDGRDPELDAHDTIRGFDQRRRPVLADAVARAAVDDELELDADEPD